MSGEVYRAVYEALGGCDPEETPAVLWMQALHEQRGAEIEGEHVDLGGRAWDYLISLEKPDRPERVAAYRARMEEAVALASIERGERWRQEYLAAVEVVAVERAHLGQIRRQVAQLAEERYAAVGGA